MAEISRNKDKNGHETTLANVILKSKEFAPMLDYRGES